MTRLRPFQILLMNLDEKISSSNIKIFLPKEKAYEILKEKTGQDFGYDVSEWRLWLIENKKF